MSNKLDTSDFAQITEIVESAFELQHHGHADVFIDWMGHFGELEIRIYWGKWTADKNADIFKFSTRDSQEKRNQVYVLYYKSVENFMNNLITVCHIKPKK
jgi:hypothetical protein